MMSSRQEIEAAARFANESPARKPLRFSVIMAILLLLVAHASFSFFAVWGLPWLFDVPRR